MDTMVILQSRMVWNQGKTTCAQHLLYTTGLLLLLGLSWCQYVGTDVLGGCPYCITRCVHYVFSLSDVFNGFVFWQSHQVAEGVCTTSYGRPFIEPWQQDFHVNACYIFVSGHNHRLSFYAVPLRLCWAAFLGIFSLHLLLRRVS